MEAPTFVKVLHGSPRSCSAGNKPGPGAPNNRPYHIGPFRQGKQELSRMSRVEETLLASSLQGRRSTPDLRRPLPSRGVVGKRWESKEPQCGAVNKAN